MLQSLYMISDLPKWGLLRFTVGDYNDGLCHIAAIRRGKLGLGVDGVRTGQWIRPDFSQSSNAPSEAPLLTTYNQRTGSLSQSPSSWGWWAGSLCLDRDRLCERLKLNFFYQTARGQAVSSQLLKFTCSDPPSWTVGRFWFNFHCHCIMLHHLWWVCEEWFSRNRDFSCFM